MQFPSEFFPKTTATISGASNGMPESDWVAPERHVEVVDVILAVGFPICIPSYPPAAPETKLGETGLLLMVVFRSTGTHASIRL